MKFKLKKSNKPGEPFVRKGKALVFVTKQEENLSAEQVQKILESGRAGRDSRNVAGLSQEGTLQSVRHELQRTDL